MEYLFKNRLSVAEYPPHISATLSMDAIADLEEYLAIHPQARIFINLMPDSLGKCYENEDLDIFKGLSSIQNVYFGTTYIRDFSGLYYLKDLKELTNLYDEMSLDYSHFTRIKALEFYWSKKDKNIFSQLNLELLRIYKYKPSNSDLSELESLVNLRELSVIQSSITSIRGIQHLNRLKNIIVAYNPKLEIDSNKLDFTLPAIEYLVIENCKKIGTDFVKVFPNLRRLDIRNQGKIPTLRPILDGLPKLEKLFVGAGTVVEESENDYYKDYSNIKEFFFQDSKNQLLKCKDLDKQWVN